MKCFWREQPCFCVHKNNTDRKVRKSSPHLLKHLCNKEFCPFVRACPFQFSNVDLNEEEQIKEQKEQ